MLGELESGEWPPASGSMHPAAGAAGEPGGRCCSITSLVSIHPQRSTPLVYLRARCESETCQDPEPELVAETEVSGGERRCGASGEVELKSWLDSGAKIRLDSGTKKGYNKDSRSQLGNLEETRTRAGRGARLHWSHVRSGATAATLPCKHRDIQVRALNHRRPTCQRTYQPERVVMYTPQANMQGPGIHVASDTR